MPAFPDEEFTLINQADQTKIARFSAAKLTTGTVTTVSLPSTGGIDATIACLEQPQTFTSPQAFDDTISSQPPVVINLSDTVANEILLVVNDIAAGKSLVLSLPVAGLATNPNVTFPDASGTLTLVNGSTDFTGKTADIASTSILTSPAAGMYRVSVYAVTTAALGAPLSIILGWTDPKQAQTFTFSLSAAAGSLAQQTRVMQIASGNITISTSGYGSGTFSVYTRVEKI